MPKPAIWGPLGAYVMSAGLVLAFLAAAGLELVDDDAEA